MNNDSYDTQSTKFVKKRIFWWRHKSVVPTPEHNDSHTQGVTWPVAAGASWEVWITSGHFTGLVKGMRMVKNWFSINSRIFTSLLTCKSSIQAHELVCFPLFNIRGITRSTYDRPLFICTTLFWFKRRMQMLYTLGSLFFYIPGGVKDKAKVIRRQSKNQRDYRFIEGLDLLPYLYP